MASVRLAPKTRSATSTFKESPPASLYAQLCSQSLLSNYDRWKLSKDAADLNEALGLQSQDANAEAVSAAVGSERKNTRRAVVTYL